MTHFNEGTIQAVWEKANVVEGYNPEIWRQDFAGAWMRRDLYGTNQAFGWEIDHLNPQSKGGNDSIGNLNPLHWQNNRRKADDYPRFLTAISSVDNHNIEKEQSWIVK